MQGGTVIGGRLQGQLGVSRAFGNYEFKEHNILTSEPEIHQISLTSEVDILLVGSDGLYEHFSNEELITFIKNGLITSSLETVVKELIEEAIDRGTEDNVSIIVVKFEKAYKKLLKKRAKKQSTGKSLLSGKSSPLRTSGKSSSSSSTSSKQLHPPDSPPPEPAKPPLFKKALNLKNSGKTAVTTLATVSAPAAPPSSPVKEVVTTSLTDIHSILPQKKKTESKKFYKLTYDDEKWNIFSKTFKNTDFFGRTAVTITG